MLQVKIRNFHFSFEIAYWRQGSTISYSWSENQHVLSNCVIIDSLVIHDASFSYSFELHVTIYEVYVWIQMFSSFFLGTDYGQSHCQSYVLIMQDGRYHGSGDFMWASLALLHIFSEPNAIMFSKNFEHLNGHYMFFSMCIWIEFVVLKHFHLRFNLSVTRSFFFLYLIHWLWVEHL